MDFNVTVNIPALDRLVDVLKAGGSLPAVAASTEGKPAENATKPASRASSQPKQDPKADAAGAAEKPKTEGTAATSTTSTTSPSDGAAAAPTAEADLNTVKAKAMELSQKKGRDVLVATLSEYGATNISGLPADQFAAFIANVEAKLAK